jgi:hypothetical protein
MVTDTNRPDIRLFSKSGIRQIKSGIRKVNKKAGYPVNPYKKEKKICCCLLPDGENNTTCR